MFGTDPNSMGAMAPTGMQFAAPKPKSGMFGGGNKTMSIIAAMLNGFNAGMPGPGREAGLQGLQMLQMARQKQLEHQQELDDYNRKRTDDNSDWQTHYQYEVDHPKTEAGSEYERLLTAAGITPGTDAYHQHVTAKVNQLENPMVMTPYGPMPYSEANPAPPTAPVGRLTPIDGGQTGAPSGGFPY